MNFGQPTGGRQTDITAEHAAQATRRMFRRYRAKFQAELGIKNPSEADVGLLNQAALLALRERQMREQILAGVIGKNTDADLVRLVNALGRVRKELRASAAAKSDASEMSWAQKQEEAERILREEDETRHAAQDDAT